MLRKISVICTCSWKKIVCCKVFALLLKFSDGWPFQACRSNHLWNGVDPDEMAHNKPFPQDLYSAFPFWLTSLFVTVDLFKYIDGRVHVRDSGRKPYKTLRKYTYSNILKISAPKTESFQIKILIFFIFLLKTWIVGTR